MKSLITAIAVLLTVFLAGSVAAHEYEIGAVKIVHPWARATAESSPNGAAYMKLSVAGAEADRLLAVATPVAKRAELHKSFMDDGVMKMRAVEGVEIVPGTLTALQPGGLHIMLMGLTAPLKEGDTFPMTLTFERAGTNDIEVVVQAMDATREGM